MYNLNLQIWPAPVDLPGWAETVQRRPGKGKNTFARLDWPSDDAAKQVDVAALIARLNKSDHGFDFNLHLTEHGGGFTNTGRAHIICAVDGGKLHSVVGRPACGQAHAVFYAREALVVTYRHHRGVGDGAIHYLGIDDNNYTMIDKLLWRFRDERPGEYAVIEPSHHSIPVAAIEAAINKSHIYHCRSAVYALGNCAGGPSGIRTWFSLR